MASRASSVRWRRFLMPPFRAVRAKRNQPGITRVTFKTTPPMPDEALRVEVDGAFQTDASSALGRRPSAFMCNHSSRRRSRQPSPLFRVDFVSYEQPEMEEWNFLLGDSTDVQRPAKQLHTWLSCRLRWG